MIVKPALAAMLASGLVAPEAPKLVFPKPAIVKSENLDFSKHMLLGMPLTMGMLAANKAVPMFRAGSSTGANQATGAVLSWTHTTVAATDCIVVGGFVNNNAGTQQITSVTFNGVSFTLLQQPSPTAQGTGSLWVLFNPPTGAFTLTLTANSADRGIGGTSADFLAVTSVNVSGQSVNAATDPRTTTITSTALGLPVGNVAGSGSGATALTFTASAPTGITLAGTARQFTSNSNAKYQGLFYSGTLVPAGSTSFTTDCTTGTLVQRNQQYAILT